MPTKCQLARVQTAWCEPTHTHTRELTHTSQWELCVRCNGRKIKRGPPFLSTGDPASVHVGGHTLLLTRSNLATQYTRKHSLLIGSETSVTSRYVAPFSFKWDFLKSTQIHPDVVRSSVTISTPGYSPYDPSSCHVSVCHRDRDIFNKILEFMIDRFVQGQVRGAYAISQPVPSIPELVYEEEGGQRCDVGGVS